MVAEELQARELAEMQQQMQSMDMAESMRLAGHQDPGTAGAGDAFGGFGIEEPAYGEPVVRDGASGLSLTQ